MLDSISTSTYTVELEDANGCVAVLILGGNNIATLSTSIDSTVAQIDPIVHQILCYGDSTGELAVDNPSTQPGFTYSWEDLNTSAITVGNSLSNLPVGTYVLSALYTDSFPACTTTDTITISQLPPMHSSASIIDADCHGDNTGSISVNITGGTSPYSYNWSPVSGTSSTINNLFAGTYILTVTDANMCDKDVTYTVSEPLALQLVIDSSQTYILTATTSGGTPPYSYSWRRNGSAIGSTGVSHNVGSYGTYTCKVTDANGCELMSNSITYEEVTGVLDISSSAINIYPNPFRDETTIDFGRVVEKVEIKLFDVLGKQVNKYVLYDLEQFILDREGKENGVYFIDVEIDNQKSSIFKLIIER